MVRLTLRSLAVPLPWQACLFPVSLPVVATEAAPLRFFLERLTLALETDFSLRRQVLLHNWKLHVEDTSAIFHAHLDTWAPEMGLGVWPDREPPSFWTQERFMDASAAGIEGNEPDLPAYRLMRLDASLTERRSAAQALFGRGALTQIFTAEDFAPFEARTREVFLPTIRASLYTHERFYMPLLDSRGLTAARTAEELERWVGNAKVYLRESAEDGGLLLLATLPLDDLLQRAADESGTTLHLITP